MRRELAFLLVLVLLLLPGCGEEVPQGPVVYEKPVFTPGTLESDLLKVEPGNYQRCADNNNMSFWEIETGYYMGWYEYVYYADSTNLDAWFLVCSDPDCAHDPLQCSAAVYENGMYLEDNRLWFTDQRGMNRLNSSDDGFYLVSAALNGADRRWEYSFEEEKKNMGGSAVYRKPYSDGFFFAADFMEPDGSTRGVIYLANKETGPVKIIERIYQDQTPFFSSNSMLGSAYISGDMCILSPGFSEDWLLEEVLCWFRDGEPVFSDISQVTINGAYLSGETLRVFLPGDGYYDLNLLAGEMTRLADAQLQNSGARILQPNCIIESTLLAPDKQVGEHQMRLYDGQQWHTVTLPEGIESTPEAPLLVVAVTSDRVVFRQKTSYKDPAVPMTRESITFYQIKLGTDSYALEYMGVNQLNRKTNEGWSYNG